MQVMKRLAADRVWSALVIALSVGLAAALCAIVHWRYAIFRNGVDLGIFAQVVGALGRGFSSTAEGGVNHLLVHWSPIVAAAWPFVRVFGPVGLEYAQAILAAAIVFPIWGLARARFSAPVAFAVTAVAATYPILCANGVGDFHEMAFVPLLSATLVWALDARRWTASVAVALLLACTKEDQFVVLAANGLLFAATARGDGAQRRVGLTIVGVAAAMSLLYFVILRPALTPHIPYDVSRFYVWSAGQLRGSGAPWGALLSRLEYVLMVLGPLAFLPCASRYGLFLLAGFAEILASRQPVTLAPGAHYSALLTGYALAAFVDGAARVAAHRARLAGVLVIAAATASLWVTIFASPMEYWYYLYRRPNAHDALLERTLRELSPRADVGAEDEIFAHLALDPNASIDFARQRWFVYDRTHFSQRWQTVDEPSVRRAVQRGDYAVSSDVDGVVVLKRASVRGAEGAAPAMGAPPPR